MRASQIAMTLHLRGEARVSRHMPFLRRLLSLGRKKAKAPRLARQTNRQPPWKQNRGAKARNRRRAYLNLETEAFKWGIMPTMAFVVPRKNGAWEIRETRSTSSGPRSATLATFRELDDEAIERARTRAAKPLASEELRQAAVRVGAPIAKSAIDEAASRLLAELSLGQKPRRGLRRLLADAVDSGEAGLSDAAKAAQEWVAATPEERGRTLKELLRLADAIPHRRRPDRIGFPRFGNP
jgi:hypothetical protein